MMGALLNLLSEMYYAAPRTSRTCWDLSALANHAVYEERVADGSFAIRSIEAPRLLGLPITVNDDPGFIIRRYERGEEIPPISAVERLSLGPDDVLVVKVPRMSEAMMGRVTEMFGQNFPGRKCLVMSDAMSLSVVQPTNEGR